MSVLRAMLVAALFLGAASDVALAEGDGECVAMRVQDYATGLRIIAHAGSVIAFGFMSGAPGDGVGYLLYITPALCGAGGLPLGPLNGDLHGVVKGIPNPIPLP